MAAVLKALEPLESRTLLAATGLVAAYSFDEGTGTKLNDLSGTGNNGTITSGTWSTAGKYGGALSFNGTGTIVTVADNASLRLTTGMTLEAWVSAASTSSSSTIMMKQGGSQISSYSLYAKDADTAGGPPAGYVYNGSGDVAVRGASAVPLNTWTHLAATFDGTALKFFVNGALVNSTAYAGKMVAGTGTLVFGKSLWTERFKGLMDDVRIYNRALSQAEVQTDMNTPIAPAAPDTTSPAVSVTAPADGSTVTGTATLTATAADNVGVAGVQFFLDGTTPIGAEDTAAPYSVSWNTAAVANGAHTITARARDAAGNATTSAVVGVTVNNVVDVAAPTVAVTSPADGASVGGTAVAVTASASDDVGVVGVQFQLDGVNLGAEDTAAPYTITWNTTAATNGAHQLAAIARDAAGHSTRSAVVNVTVANADTTAPTVSLSAPAAGSTVSGTAVTVSANASDNVGVYGVQFLLDGNVLGAEDTAAPYSVAWDSTTASNGTHTLTARARDAAGNVTTSAARTVTVSNIVTDPTVVGQWGPVTTNPLVVINSVLMKNGKVLMWDGGPQCIGWSSARVWDPVTNVYTPVPVNNPDDTFDIFCSGSVALADGRIAVVGGHDCAGAATGTKIGNPHLLIFDPDTMKWTVGPDMSYSRWYPTATLLPDGRVLATAGSDISNYTYIPVPEVYDPVTNKWTKLTSATQTIENYPFMFILPDGRVLEAGSDEAALVTRVLDLHTLTWSVVDPNVVDGGSAVMYRPGKILKNGSFSGPTAPNDNANNTSYVLDMTQTNPHWQQTPSMAYARNWHDLTVLPDGNVLVTGGATDRSGVTPSKAVFPAEMWNPDTQTYATLASMQTPRLYHSTALLLPDGRVLVAGGGHNYQNNADYFSSEIYSPPYLFKGARPTITAAPTAPVDYNSTFSVQTPDAASISSVVLVRPGNVTHAFDMEQRYVPLNFTKTAGGLTVQAPVDTNLAPPGYYMLFVVNANGVPSVASFVRLPAGYEDKQVPTAPPSLTATPGTGSVALAWGASTDNVGVVGYNVYRSTTSGFTPSAATLLSQVTGTTFTDRAGTPGVTYYYVITARDAMGNISPPSAQVAAAAQSDTTAPTVTVTSPASGATVSGVINLTASAADDGTLAGVQFFVDGVAVGGVDTSAPYSVAWSSSAVPNGTHTITARATDGAGNATTSVGVGITVSNAASLPGLVASYDFNAGSGTTLADGSGHGLNGTIANGTWSTAGHAGGALSFNGTSTVVTVADNALLRLTTGMTVEAWVSGQSTAASSTVLMKQGGNQISAYSLYAKDADSAGTPPAGYVFNGSSDVTVHGTSALALGAWTHLATTFDGATLRMYVNGNLVGSTPYTGNIAAGTGALLIGNSLWNERFKGLMDDLRIYNRALSQAEIQGEMGTTTAAAAALAAPMTALAASPPPPISSSSTATTTSATPRTTNPLSPSHAKRPKPANRPPAVTAPIFSARLIPPTTGASADNIARDDANDAPRGVLS